MSSLEAILQLLQIPPASRTLEDLRRLKSLTSHITFFQRLTAEHGSDSIHTSLCNKMTLRSYAPDQYIFKCNDPGDFFCIILKGKVSVQVLDDSLFFKRTPTKDIEKTPGKLADYLTLSLDLSSRVAGLSADDVCPIGPEVDLLEAGSVFGELSLISGKPRAASMQCKEQTFCAVLIRSDYIELLGAYEQQKLMDKISMLARLPLFRGWTQSYLKKQHFYFREALYLRNQVVFTEGRPAEYLYIIKEGEFKATSRQTYKQQPLDNSKSSNLVSRGQATYKRLEVQLIQLVIKGPRELLGDEELIKEIDYTCSCECVSLTGTLIMIKQSDMRFRVNHPETWQYLRSKHETEGKWMTDRVTMLEKTKPPWEDQAHRISTLQAAPMRQQRLPVKPKTLDPRPFDLSQEQAVRLRPRPVTRSSPPVTSALLLNKLRETLINRPASLVRSTTPSVHRRLPSKPPPNFFVDPQTALIQKYSRRQRIVM
jgi:CRP-like cAMP-binding protein